MAIRDQNKALRNGVSDSELCSAMVRLSSLALSKTDPDRIISEALREIRKTLGTRICWMFLVEEDRTILKGLGDAASRRGPAGSELLLKLSPKILKRTYPIICNRIGELYKENRVLHRFLRQRDIGKFMGVPLKKDGRLIGALNVGRGRDARDFTREDLKSSTMLGSVLVISRLRAAESESRQAQSFLEAIIDNIPNPVFIKDRKHRYVVLNQAFSELVGHSREKMLGKSDYDFFSKDQADFFCKKDEEMFRTGKVVDIPEEPVTDKDGKLHHLHTKKAPLRDSSGKITHLVGIIEDIGERLQSESVLRESEQKYRLLVENIKEGIYSVQEGMFTNVNESMCRMFGYTKEEMLGMPSWNLAVPAKRDSVRELFFAKATKGDFSPAEVECMRKDGSVFVAEIGLSAVTGERQFLGVVSDITERKKAEGALRESEEKYRLLIESSDAAITFFDKNGTYLLLNSLAANWLQGKPDDYIGKTVYDTFPKSLAGKFVKRFRKIIKSGVGETIEEIVEQPPGGRFISSNLQPVRDQNGKIAGVQIVTHDITERKRTEEALRGSENKYRMLLENLPQRIFFKDANSVYISCNDNFAQDLNIKPDEITGKTDYDFFPKELAEKYEADDKRIMESGEIEDIEEVYIQDGKKVFVHTVKTPIKDKNGNIVGILGIFWDITERKRAEKALIQNERTARERARLLTDLRDLDQIDNILARVCRAVRDSELFKRAVMTLHDQPRRISSLGQVGLPPDLVRRARRAPPMDQKTRARITSKKFRISDSFFIPAEAGVDFSKTGRYIPQKKRNSVGGDWQPGDELFVPLRDFSGKIMGFLSVDTPTDGCRPDIKTIEALEMLVEAAASRVREVEAQEALQQGRDFSQSILETANSLIVCLDADAKITVFNQECERVTGYRSEEVIGKRWPELCLPPEHHHFKLKSFVKWVRAHPSDRYEGPIVTKSGEIRTILWSNTAILGPEENEIVAIAIGQDVTERKRADEEIRKFKTISDRAGYGSAISDLKGDIIYVNESFARMHGYRPEELVGKHLSFLHQTSQLKDVNRLNRKLMREGSFVAEEVWHTRKDGVVFPTLMTATVIKDDEGRPLFLSATAIDVTQRKRAEEALKKSEEKFRTFMETASDLMDTTDENGNITYVNESMVRTLGYSKEEMIGMHITQLLTKEALKKDFKSNWEEFIANGEMSIETTLATKDRKEIYGELKAVATYDSDGQYAGSRTVFHDLTERKRAEEALKESGEKYRLLVENLTDMIVEFDTEGRLLFVSPSYCQTFGKSEEDILGKKFMPLIHKDDRENVKKVLAGIYEPPHVAYVEERAKTVNGWRWQSWVNTAVLDENDNVVKVVAVGRDITERKRAEEALQKSEGRYRSLFEDSPISLWEEDFSEVKKYIDRLRDSGIKDFRLYFESHPKAVSRCASLVKVIDVNKASLRLYKARNKEDLKSGLGKIFASESYYPFKEELIAVAEGKTRFEKEADARTLRGDSKHVSVTWSVAPGHEETLSKIVVAITDVTEAKEAEEALRRSEEMHRTLVETAQEGIGIVDSKENLIFVNRAFAQLLGYRRDELLGKNLKEISDSTQYGFFREETKKRKEGKSSKYEITLLTKRGKRKPVYVSAAPLWKEDGSFRGTLGVLSDLTEIKKAREYNVLLNASRSLSQTLKFDQVLKLGSEKMTQALNADRCAVMLPGNDVSGSSIQVQVHPFPSRGKDSPSAWSLKVTKEHLSSYKRSLQARGSIQIFNVRTDLAPELGKKILRKTGMVSALVIPILLRNKMLGVFHVGMTKKARTFNTEEERLARTMANQAAAALQNCRLMEDVRKEHAQIIEQAQLLSTQYREQKALYELTQTLSSPRGLDHLLTSAIKKVGELVKTERSSIALLDPEGKSVSIRAAHIRGKPLETDLIGWTFRVEDFPQLIEMVHKGKPFMVNDTSILAQGHPARKYLLRRGVKSTLSVPLLYRGKYLGFLTVATTTGVHRYTKKEIRLLQTISNSIAVTIENYRLLEDLKQKYAQIREQTRSLEKQTLEKDILLKVSRALSKTMDLDEVGRVASQVVGSTLGVERCAITLVTKENYELTVKGLYSKDRTQDRKTIGTKFLWNDIPDMCNRIKKRKPFVIQNTSDFYPEGKTKEYFLTAGIKSVLGTGMFFGDKLVGILSITSIKKHRTFSQEEVKLVQTLANQIGVAIENARLQQVVEKHAQDLKDLYSQLLKTQENERKKIAQELHDQVGQMLQSMKMNLDWMKRGLTSKPQKLERMEDWLLDTEKLLGETIDDIRNLTFELRPSMLDDFGLIPALRWYIDNYGRRSSIRVSLKTRNKKYRFPPEVVITLYRIIQEALTNVAKHSGATEASVSVSQKGSTAILSVRDNGKGFDFNKALLAPKGMGLLNIKERVDMLGGDFEIISRPRKGTKLNIQIPFQEVQYEED